MAVVRWCAPPCAVLAVLIGAWVAPDGAARFAVLAGGVPVLGALLLRRGLPVAFAVFLAVGLALPHLLETAVVTDPVRVYALDLALAALGGATVAELWRRRRLPPWSMHLGLLLAVSAGLLGWGLSQGHAPLEALGTVRRVGLYALPFAFGAVAADGVGGPGGSWARLRYALLAAAVVAGGLALWRMGTGVGFRAAYFAAHGVPSRFLSYLEALAALGGILVLLGRGPTGRPAWDRAAWPLLALLGAAVLSSNYRSVWLALAVALVVEAVTLGRRHLPRMAAGAAAVALGAVIATGALSGAAPTDSPVQRLDRANVKQGVHWRTASWGRAWEVFSERPLLGEGLGYEHRFAWSSDPDRRPVPIVEGRSIHNDALWLLANGGLLLLLAVASFHLRWFGASVSRFRRPAGEAPPPEAAAVLALVSAMWVLSMLQPVLSQPTAAAVAYGLMGFSLAAGARRLPSTRGEGTEL